MITLSNVISALAVALAAGGLIFGRQAVKRHDGRADIWEHRFMGAVKESADVERTLARALHYPKYGDPRADGTVDPCPITADPNDYVTGAHTPASLALEAARRIRDLETLARKLQGADPT